MLPRILPEIHRTRLASVLKFLARNHPGETGRSLALAALSDPTYVALGALHDYLEEEGFPQEGQLRGNTFSIGEKAEEGMHPGTGGFNFRGAMQKLQRDQEVKQAFLDHAEVDIPDPDNPHGPYIRVAVKSLPPKGKLRAIQNHLLHSQIPHDVLGGKYNAAAIRGSQHRVSRNAVDRLTNLAGAGRDWEEHDAKSSLSTHKSLYDSPGTQAARMVTNYARGSRSSLKPALRRLRSRQQRGLHQIATQIQTALGLRPAKNRDALFDSDAHSASALAQAIYHDSDLDTVRYAAAWYGHLAQSPALSLFHVGEGGDSLYRLSHSDPEALREALSAEGVSQRTLLPRGDSWDALVLDPGRRLRDSVAAAAKRLGIETVEESEGTAEALGAGTKKATARGRKAYREVIETYEAEATKKAS